ncbi:MAG: hypothetical protein UIH27_04735 [Ruminococcus sp.]|nr:hypothetical protein [Ruminococcus sp.]
MKRKKISIAILVSILAVLQIATIGISALHTDKSFMENDYLKLYVGQDGHNLGRYQVSANKGNLDNDADDNKNLMYENFYSSYTTIAVNGKAYRFGEGESVAKPYYDRGKDACITVQKFGAVEVTQSLTFADGMETGHDDMLLVSYSAENTGSDSVLLGFRIMIDSQLDKDDRCKTKADNAPVAFEKKYSDSLPGTWQVASQDGAVTAYGKLSTMPDSVILANWSSLSDKKWNYIPDASKDISDAAAALVWDNSTLEAGQSGNYSVYYGVKNREEEKPSEPSVPSEPTETADTTAQTEASQQETTETADTTAQTEASQQQETTEQPGTTQNSEASELSSNTEITDTTENSAQQPHTGAPATPDNSQTIFSDGKNILTGDSVLPIFLTSVLAAVSAAVVLITIRKKGGSRHE